MGGAGDDEGVVEDWRVGRGGSGERGNGLNYVRRVAPVTAHAGHAGLRSTCRILSEPSKPSRLIIRLRFHPPAVVFGPFPSLDLAI